MESTLFTALSPTEEANLSGGNYKAPTKKYYNKKVTTITLTGGNGGNGGNGGAGGAGINNTGKGKVIVKDKAEVKGGAGGAGGAGGDGAPAIKLG
ncbi:hypothetical protein [Nostoc sp. JL33]|uniref:hypothetical protein n=1 Tax=Nostoc sp. JL33 TaxID=2815396 RepID=UPI0025D87509|nr:hypothetical protein [Nostoc sp. JL33]MBN3869981.1 hypothetical protein [Nostoc sp. JL33]